MEEDIIIATGNQIRKKQLLGMLILAKESLYNEIPMIAILKDVNNLMKPVVLDLFLYMNRFKLKTYKRTNEDPVEPYLLHYLHDVSANYEFPRFDINVNQIVRKKCGNLKKSFERRIHKMKLDHLSPCIYPYQNFISTFDNIYQEALIKEKYTDKK